MNYIVKRSNRRTVGLEITGDCEIIVRAPNRMSEKEIAEFINKYQGWIDEKLPEAQKRAEKAERLPVMKKACTKPPVK